MNQEVGSIMAFFHSLFPVKIYTKEVPENFRVPSMYFPVPQSFDSPDTNMTYRKTYTLPIKLFHHDSWQANKHAEHIAETIRRKRNVIPLVDEKGARIGSFLRINRIEVRIADSGVANIIVNWDSNYFYDRESYPALDTVDFDGGLKNESI